MTGSAWVTSIFCPTIGMILANIMWLSSMPAVLSCRVKKSLGQLNPLPYACIVHNCIGWSTYGILIHDYYIFYANCTGVVLGIFYCTTCLSILYHESAREAGSNFYHIALEFLLIFGFSVWFIVFSIVFIDYSNLIQAKNVIGYIGDTFHIALLHII